MPRSNAKPIIAALLALGLVLVAVFAVSGLHHDHHAGDYATGACLATLMPGGDCARLAGTLDGTLFHLRLIKRMTDGVLAASETVHFVSSSMLMAGWAMAALAILFWSASWHGSRDAGARSLRRNFIRWLALLEQVP